MSQASSAWWRALKEADSSVWWRACNEVLIVGGLSILPLLLSPYATFLIQDLLPDAQKKSLSELFLDAIFDGQLYFYAMSFVAAVFWHSGQELRKPFPLRLLFLSVALILTIFCVFFFSVSPALPNNGAPVLSIASVVVYVISAVSYCVILVFKSIDPPDFDRHKRESETALEKELKQRRGIG